MMFCVINLKDILSSLISQEDLLGWSKTARTTSVTSFYNISIAKDTQD